MKLETLDDTEVGLKWLPGDADSRLGETDVELVDLLLEHCVVDDLAPMLARNLLEGDDGDGGMCGLA